MTWMKSIIDQRFGGPATHRSISGGPICYHPFSDAKVDKCQPGQYKIPIHRSSRIAMAAAPAMSMVIT
jgi:hypothetical protein